MKQQNKYIKVFLLICITIAQMAVNASISKGMIGARGANICSGNGAHQPYWGLCFTAEKENSTVKMVATGTPPSVTLEYSIDMTTWEPFIPGTTTIVLSNVGDKVYLKAGNGGNTTFTVPYYANNRWNFSMTGTISASGNIMSLLNGQEPISSITTKYAFNQLFFKCSSLISCPELPATTISEHAYDSMFRESGIINPPKLPCMQCSKYCYSQMFYLCRNLRTPPELPSTYILDFCYNRMFYGCSLLVGEVVLPARTLQNLVYREMFYGCQNLSAIKMMSMTWGNATTDWVKNVAPTGTFYCSSALGTNETITRGVSGCPTGWTVVNID